MKTRSLMLVLTAFGAAYAGLALRAGPGRAPGSRSLLSDPVPDALAETSGTRLKAKVTTGADGSQLFDSETLHDATLDADCTFHKSSDGAQRCLPIVGPNAFNDFGKNAFTDDQCTQRVVFVPASPGGCTQVVPKYVYEFVAAPVCGATEAELGIRVYQTLGLAGSITGTYLKNAQGNCVQTVLSLPDTVPYELTAEIAPTTFVAGTAGLDP